jgi:hypothetical protein
MKVSIEAFLLPKAGNSPEEYEDAYFPTRAPSDDVDSLRLAVADGATETSFSAAWANLLVRGFCRHTINPDTLKADLASRQAVWKRHVQRKPLPWYAEQKIADGAFAAIVGLELHRKNRRWDAFAIGDCCVFHTRGETILTPFPMEDAEQFDNRPALISSVAENNNGVLDLVKTAKGAWESGDTFYLMSDAIAAWFLRYAALKDTNAVGYLKTIATQRDFADVVSLQRSDPVPDGHPGQHMMRNDDVTLLACVVT